MLDYNLSCVLNTPWYYRPFKKLALLTILRRSSSSPQSELQLWAFCFNALLYSPLSSLVPLLFHVHCTFTSSYLREENFLKKIITWGGGGLPYFITLFSKPQVSYFDQRKKWFHNSCGGGEGFVIFFMKHHCFSYKRGAFLAPPLKYQNTIYQ